MKAAVETGFIELEVIDLPGKEKKKMGMKKVKSKCCKKYKKKGKHCKKCPRLLLSDPKVNFSSASFSCEA